MSGFVAFNGWWGSAQGWRTRAFTGRETPENWETDFVREGSGYYRCGRCRSESVASHRRRLKAKLIDEAGGKCILCGYDRQPRALAFHHLDPAQKGFALSQKGVTLSLQALRAEAGKCVLLCSNCHAEVEDGYVALPDTIVGGLGMSFTHQDP